MGWLPAPPASPRHWYQHSPTASRLSPRSHRLAEGKGGPRHPAPHPALLEVLGFAPQEPSGPARRSSMPVRAGWCRHFSREPRPEREEQMAVTPWFVPGTRGCPGLQRGTGQPPAGQTNPSAGGAVVRWSPKSPRGLSQHHPQPTQRLSRPRGGSSGTGWLPAP